MESRLHVLVKLMISAIESTEQRLSATGVISNRSSSCGFGGVREVELELEEVVGVLAARSCTVSSMLRRARP